MQVLVGLRLSCWRVRSTRPTMVNQCTRSMLPPSPNTLLPCDGHYTCPTVRTREETYWVSNDRRLALIIQCRRAYHWNHCFHSSSLLWLSGRCVRGRGGLLGVRREACRQVQQLQGEVSKACCALSRGSISTARLPNFAWKSKRKYRFRLYTDSSVTST